MRILLAVLGFALLVSAPAQEELGKLVMQLLLGSITLAVAFLWPPVPFDNEVK